MSFFEDSFGFAGFGDIADPSYVPTLLNGSPGTGGWTTISGFTAMVVTGAHRCRGAATANCGSICTVDPGVDEYDVACDFFIASITGITATTNTGLGTRFKGTGWTASAGLHLLLVGDATPTNLNVQLNFNWDVITTIATVSGTDWSGGQAYHCVMKVRKNSAHSFQVTVTITRTADGKYLKSDGTWQSSPQNVIDVAYDDSTPASINHGLGDIGNGSVAVTEFDYSGESAGVHIDNVVMTGVVTSGITVNPSSIVNHSTGNLITITGIGTTWTAGTPGTPTFTVDSGTITAQTVTSATSATITLSAPTTNGTITVTDPSTGNTATISVVSPSTLIAGVAEFDYATVDEAFLKTGAASGGTPPITVQWKRSNTASGSYSNVSGMTGLAAADTSLPDKTIRFWKAVYTDNAPTPQTATSNIIPGRLWDDVPLVMGFIGDSWTTDAHCAGVVSYLNKIRRLRKVTLGPSCNRGIGGTGVVTWDPTNIAQYDGSLDAALPVLAAAPVNLIEILLGTNDASNGTTATEWATRLTNICNYIFAYFAAHSVPAPIIVLSAPAWRDGSGAAGEQVLLDYHYALPAICNGTTILQGTTLMYDWGATKYLTELLPGTLHPNDVGAVSVQFMVANAIQDALYPPGSGGGGGMRINGGLVS